MCDPLADAVSLGADAPAASLARRFARLLAPETRTVSAPPWLLPAHVLTLGRVLAALHRFGGALLADPVGTGKTYVALAAAAMSNEGSPAACLVPASLAAQWRRVAAETGVPIVTVSHELASRRSLPALPPGLVLIDESHRLRSADTARYSRIADALLGRRVLLLSATPAVNGLSDVATQLALALRDDALAGDGTPSLRGLLGSGAVPAAIGRVVFARPAAAVSRPDRREHTIEHAVDPACGELLAAVDALTLSRDPAVAALVRGSLWRALASSPGAFAAAVARYRRLLQHADDAASAGRRLSRRELLRATGGLDAQLLLWELLPDGTAALDLACEDAMRLERLHALAVATAAADDHKVSAVRERIDDADPTLVFSTYRETVRWLRDRLVREPVAWCTGDRSGVGATAMPRGAVLDLFRRRDADDRLRLPRVLIASDVAAEGLDLTRVARVVHYDLPWTPARLDQRDGRALRGGSRHATVDVVRCLPPPAIERRLRQCEVLARKATLPLQLGLDARTPSAWRWRADIVEQLGLVGPETPAAAAHPGIAYVRSTVRGVLICLTRANDAASLVWCDDDAGESEAIDHLDRRLREAADTTGRPCTADERTRATTAAAAVIRRRLAEQHGAAWTLRPAAPAARTLLRRLDALARHAARQRDARLLGDVERAMAFAARGHTAGEARLVERLAGLADASLPAAIRALPRATPVAAATLGLAGAIVFGP